MTQRVRLLAPVALLIVGAVLLWISSRVVWLDVVAFNDQSGEADRALVGAEWQPALVPLALGALAAVAAVSLVRGVAARVVGAVIALLGIAAGGLMFSGMGEPDPDRVHAVITSAEDVGRTNAGPGATEAEAIPEWSRITDISVGVPGAVLTGVAALALLAAGMVVLLAPARRVSGDDRYVTPAVRRENARAAASAGMAAGDADGAVPGDASGTVPGDADGTVPGDASGTVPGSSGGTTPGDGTGDAGRDLWQELDEGRDPTG